METNKGTNDSQNGNKEYPGYSPEPESEEATGLTAEDGRVAEKGPLRNPNYHDMDDKIQSGSNYSRNDSAAVKSSDGKTLEDYNDTNPKRDINKQDNSNESDTSAQ